MKTMKHYGKRGVAVLLAIMMCLSMLNLTVFAAGDTSSKSSNTVADASTKEDWKNYFTGRDTGYGNNAAAGFVWTDKSVAVMDGSSDTFEITYSALGSADVTTAVDLVLVLDISGSMGDPLGKANPGDSVTIGEKTYTVNTYSPPRMYYLMLAVNEFMEKFMNQSEENRIAIVVYDSCAYELLPLDHYTKMDNADYVTASRHHWQSWGTNGQYASTLTTQCINSSNDEVKNSVTSWGNTNLMAGIGAGMDILKNADTAVTLNNSTSIQRNPVLVVMTDGEANTYVTNNNSWNASSNKEMGPEAESNPNADYCQLHRKIPPISMSRMLR